MCSPPKNNLIIYFQTYNATTGAITDNVLQNILPKYLHYFEYVL